MQKGCRQPRRPGGWLSASFEERRGGESQADAIGTDEETGGAKAGAWAVERRAPDGRAGQIETAVAWQLAKWQGTTKFIRGAI